VLLVEDVARVRRSTMGALVTAGFTVEEAADALTLWRKLATVRPRSIVLDLGLPDADGLDLITELRARSSVPIIVVTGRVDHDTLVDAFERGADDYVRKPFVSAELIARLNALLRRSVGDASTGEAHASSSDVLCFDGFRLDRTRRELRYPTGVPCPLTGSEFELLTLLIEKRGSAVSREEIMERLKGRPWQSFRRAADMQVLRLRRKIETDPNRPRLITSVRGLGYCFAAEVSPATPGEPSAP
jgi:DNA-binding response OmpR family regulator